MANFPIVSYALPGCDPPLIYTIKDDNNNIVLKTDNCGLSFEVFGDKRLAAIAFIKWVFKCNEMYSKPWNTTYRIGAIDFIFKNNIIIDVRPHFSEAIPYTKHAPEDRSEVLEMIEILKTICESVMNMKAFW